jgi:CRISPR/Cas system CSM-associated protein Csm3 (group 7 of RAMP superfamily)
LATDAPERFETKNSQREVKTMADISKSPIQSMVFLRLRLTLRTPLSVGSGEDDHSDHDCVRDYDGKPFIPATSIAGLLRSSMEETSAKRLMGYAKDREAEQSRLMISDGIFINQENTLKISVRDGVALDENRVTRDTSKYDYEVIQPGACFETQISFKVLESDVTPNEEAWQTFAAPLLSALQFINEDKLRLGYKTNRGLGSLAVSGHYKIFLGKDDLKNSIAFRKQANWSHATCIDSLIKEAKNPTSTNFHTITVKASIPATICVRQYASLAEISQADHQQLSDGHSPVIPGSSLAGAFRNTAEVLLRELGMDDRNVLRSLAWLFGHVPSKEQTRVKKSGTEKMLPDSWASAIRFREAKIAGGNYLPLTRTKVDRFSGSAAKGALFSQKVHQGGNTELSIQIRGESLEWAVGLVLLVLKDIHAGLTAFGGEVAVGRGIMQLLDKPTLSSQNETQYLQQLASFLDAVKKNEDVFPPHVLAAFPYDVSPEMQENTDKEVAL